MKKKIKRNSFSCRLYARQGTHNKIKIIELFMRFIENVYFINKNKIKKNYNYLFTVYLNSKIKRTTDRRSIFNNINCFYHTICIFAKNYIYYSVYKHNCNLMYIISCVIYVIDNNLENFGKQGNSENKKKYY